MMSFQKGSLGFFTDEPEKKNYLLEGKYAIYLNLC
jgi:hypothetical protein